MSKQTGIRGTLILPVFITVAALVSLVHAPEAGAATLTVTSNADSGAGTLREAVGRANENDEADTITFDLLQDQRKITLVSDIRFEDPLPTTVDGSGQGVTVSGGDTTRVFWVHNGEAVIKGLTVSGGHAFAPGVEGAWSLAFNSGGGILVTHGALTVADSTISGNSSGWLGGGIQVLQSALTVADSTISGNKSGGGGGISNFGGVLTVADSTVSGNEATGPGGGGGSGGGGIYSYTNTPAVSGFPALPNATTTIENSTVSGNSVNDDGGYASGGGVRNASGLTTIRSTTVSGNSAPRNGGAGVAGSALGYVDDQSYTETVVGSSIIVADPSTTAVDLVDRLGPNTFTSEGHNVIGDGNAVIPDGWDDAAFDRPTDQTGVADPKLGPLQDNGGPTETHALLPGSPATDRGDTANCPQTDQRKVSRPQDGACDVGAFEMEQQNAPPEAAGDAYSTDEDAALDVPAPGVLANDADADKNGLSAVLVSGPVHAASFALDKDGSFSYAPNKDFGGDDSFTYKANDGTADSNTVTVGIKVKSVNDAPTISVIAGSASRSACTGDTSGRITLELSDADDAPGALSLGAASSNTRLVPRANVAFNGTGGTRTATVSATSGRTGTSVVTVTASDGRAGGRVPVTVEVGGNGSDTLLGTAGTDLLLGQKGGDALRGTDGSDVLCGAGGNDRLVGGRGSDTFDGGSGTDTATDFNQAEGDSGTNIP